ncbi:twin-arginine translocation signal domain-containing protein [Streptomyces sp. NPDC042319]|uniref:twin-arginine translocation signal domain-containing protein n=1 Tax=Streptomyces sp. NPDC042319 TaxID=3154332 RepID=UPI0033FC61F2
MQNEMTRRAVVKGAAVMGAAAAASSFMPGTASAASKGKTKKIPTSANGWPIEREANHVSTVWSRPVAGTGLDVEVRIGDVEAILVHVIRRFHYEVQEIPRVDLAGWREIGKLRASLPESNLASGTAVQIRPGASAKGGFFPAQEMVLRDILADCEGVVRWGGDDTEVNESLFYIDRGPNDEQVRKLADKLRAGEATPGEGAGVNVDVRTPSRRNRADRLARTQRSA